MRISILAAAAAAALLTAGAALAQSPAPSTDRSGGPTATAGSSAEPNAPAGGHAMTAKKPMKHHKMAPKTSGSTGGQSQPDGQGGNGTPSGR